MTAKVLSATSFGLEPVLVEVEADLSRGFPQFNIVGLGDTAIQEAKDRVRSALQNCGFHFPNNHVTINLAPADVRKEGPRFDLPIALAILQASGEIELPDKEIFIGELSLEGKIRPVTGILNVAILAKEQKIKRLYVPATNAPEAALISGLEIIPLSSLEELFAHLNGQQKIMPLKEREVSPTYHNYDIDFANILGQEHAKRALEITAAGGHNVLMSGPPGSGKTIMAKATVSILPKMTEEEMIAATRIWSIAGLLSAKQPLVNFRPFRHPHHSASLASLVGGGRIPKPGEISLATYGVLFLDEFPEFPREVIESLRQPLEDRVITVSRVYGSAVFPANFILLAAQNPCPCGWRGDTEKECLCTATQIMNYRKKISGPVLDRLDLFVNVPRVKFDKMKKGKETSCQIRSRVERARAIQRERFKNKRILVNAEMGNKEIEAFCPLANDCQNLLREAIDKFQLSTRGYFRLLKISRTIADLSSNEEITHHHLAEALQYRQVE